MTFTNSEGERETPEFLRWTLSRPCPLREGALDDPAGAQRELRNLRAFAEAREEGRIVHGWCLQIDPQGIRWGFSAEEILNYYGGLEFAESCCTRCEANIPSTARAPADDDDDSAPAPLAGCWGVLPVERPAAGFDIRAAVARQIQLNHMAQVMEERFLPTEPAWYGLWAASPLSAGQLELLLPLFEPIPLEWPEERELARLVGALRAGRERGLPLHVELGPAGIIRGRRWHVRPYCPRCRATSAPDSRFCRICRRQGGPHATRTRMALGRRPYRRLNGG